MARREWARKLIDKQPMARGGDSVDGNAAIKLLKAEHARAVRIVKRATIAISEPCYRGTEFEQGYTTAIENILAALTKGRGKGGRDDN